jgi:hypothetical protein
VPSLVHLQRSPFLSLFGLLVGLTTSCTTDPTLQSDAENRETSSLGGTDSGTGATTSRGGTDSGTGGTTSLGGADSGTGGTTAPAVTPWDPETYFDGSSRFNGLPETSCAVTVTSSEVSSEIPTVGIVRFDTDLSGLTTAEIHFGLDRDYGLVAPVDLAAEGYRTLVLGMIQDRTYHYRVAVSDGASVCYGDDQTIETGSLNTTALAEATTSDGAAPGFIVTARDGTAVIYDKQGELVWAYDLFNVFSVQMSWDGRYMIGRDAGPFDLAEGGVFYRLEMDGSNFETLDAPGGDHHDFTAIPGGIAYLAKTDEGQCDSVYEASIDIVDGAPSFDTWQIYQYFPDVGATEGTEVCHANRLHYSLEQDLYTISDRNKDAIAIFARNGSPITSIGRTPLGDWTQHIQAENAGPGEDWHVQHGHHFYADDKLVVFSNDSTGGALVLHYTLSGSNASLDWKYGGAGFSTIQGDVERLPNGNFLVTANLGDIVELGPDGQTEVSRYVLGGAIGPLYGFTYSRHRPSLYGAPAPR